MPYFCYIAAYSDTMLVVKRERTQEEGEQFKRLRMISNEASGSLLAGEKSNEAMVSGPKKVELPKLPRYIDTRVADIYPVTKPGDRLKILSSKDKFKDAPLFQKQIKETNQGSTPSDVKLSSKFIWRRNGNHTSSGNPDTSINSAYTNKNVELKAECQEYNNFRNVAELSSSSPALSSTTTVDMAKAFKGLANNKASTVVTQPRDSPGLLGNLGSSLHANSFGHDLPIAGDRVPLDLSLKVNMRLISSSSLNWCHMLNNTSKYMGMKEFMFRFDCSHDKVHANYNSCSQFSQQKEISFWKALHSWVYPQSMLPSSLISTMALSAARGSVAESEFLSKRQSAWEDSFRSIYYMFRKRTCDIFYFCTQQFIVMFVGGSLNAKMENTCAAYLTRSTRGLRAFLKKHDVGFSMPLCSMEVEQATTEDLQELSEFEKINPGQTRVVDSMPDIDNTSQSLLAFIGNENVHGLYDFLLNHRSFLSSVACVDVPLLYSPVAFQNASLHVPEVSCKQMKRAEAVCKPSIKPVEQTLDSAEKCFSVGSTNVSYTVEIKEGFLPPWVISGICAAVGANQENFEASFVTEPLSYGLNVALDAACEKEPTEKSIPDKLNCTGSFVDSVLCPSLRSATIKHLKYLKGSYVASVSYV